MLVFIIIASCMWLAYIYTTIFWLNKIEKFIRRSSWHLLKSHPSSSAQHCVRLSYENLGVIFHCVTHTQRESTTAEWMCAGIKFSVCHRKHILPFRIVSSVISSRMRAFSMRHKDSESRCHRRECIWMCVVNVFHLSLESGDLSSANGIAILRSTRTSFVNDTKMRRQKWFITIPTHSTSKLKIVHFPSNANEIHLNSVRFVIPKISHIKFRGISIRRTNSEQITSRPER